jgi:hypothetical protein
MVRPPRQPPSLTDSSPQPAPPANNATAWHTDNHPPPAPSKSSPPNHAETRTPNAADSCANSAAANRSQRAGDSSGLVRPRWDLAAVARARYSDLKQRQLRLGTKWESRALASALCCSVLLTCARASSAETWKGPGDGDVDAFLGVKGSPVQIRPSRLVFRTLVPQIGNEISHDRSHLSPATRASIQGGDYTVLMTALPRRRRFPGPAGRLGDLSIRQTRVGLDQHAIVETA